MLRNIVGLIIVLVFTSCAEKPKPKPYGELRLQYATPSYIPFNGDSPFTFEYSDQAEISQAKRKNWYNMRYPKMHANVFITYFPIHNDFNLHVKEVEKMVYEHTIKASAIDTKSFEYPKNNTFGNFYELKGYTASNIQFFITDSTKHFVTANLYFNSRPRPDSLQPAVEYIKQDLTHMISTFQWKN